MTTNLTAKEKALKEIKEAIRLFKKGILLSF